MGIETVSLIIAAFVSGSLGIAALMRNFRSRLCVSFAALCGILFIHDGLGVLEGFESAGGWASPRLHTLMILVAGPILLWFLYGLLPGFRKRLKKWIAGLVPAIALVTLLLYTRAYSRLALLLYILAHIAFLLPAAVWVITLGQAELSSTLTRERLRLRYAFWGGVIVLVFFLTNALAFVGVRVPPLGTLARVLYLIFIFQTFIQKELMTSEEVVAKVALFGGIALMLSAIYALLVSWVGQPDLFFFNTFIASFVILVLFDPIRNLTTRLTRKAFLHRNAMLEDELNSLSVELMGVVEPVDVFRRLAVALSRSLGTETLSFYVLERDGFSFLRLDPSERSGPVAELLSSNPLVEYMLMRRGRAFVLETIENDRDSFHSAQPRKFCHACLESMRKLSVDFVIPFLYESKVVGFCGVKTGERVALSNEQLRLFLPVARQIALLLKNAQTFTFLRDRDKLAAVGEMAAGLAHEIKNPLGAIKGAAELLKDNAEKSRQAEVPDFLKIILDETDRLSGVLTDFLDYAKPRRHDLQTSCDPLRVIEHTAALVLRDAKISLEIESEKQGLTLEADPEVLKQVLLNLFINAVQATEGMSDKPAIKVRVREIRPRKPFSFIDSLPLYKVWEGWEALKTAGPQPYIEIEVQDNGVGIQPEDMSRIFVPFFTTKPRGTGLGLPICQRLVEGMGGSIYVKAHRPGGTVFTIHLPVRREEPRDPVPNTEGQDANPPRGVMA